MKLFSRVGRAALISDCGKGFDIIFMTSMSFSVMLLFVRVVYTGRPTFLFLVWNLFLALIPLFISSMLLLNPQHIKRNGRLIVILLGWILFLPNSFYIITDLFHLGRFPSIPKWFDLTMIFSFGWNGIILGVISIRQMERVCLRLFPSLHPFIFLIPVMLLNAFGIYIGRFLRFNSWDFVTSPMDLLEALSEMVLHPFHNKGVWIMICCFAFLMTIIYLTLKKFRFR